jgi:hypothetical protein
MTARVLDVLPGTSRRPRRRPTSVDRKRLSNGVLGSVTIPPIVRLCRISGLGV